MGVLTASGGGAFAANRPTIPLGSEVLVHLNDIHLLIEG